MRPRLLELEGFTSFRERTTVDFEGADLFVLTGPTGSGKSSLIDAMTFALYGAVPRYEHRALIAPVVSQGLLEARVRLKFTVGNRDYQAVRVVRRNPNTGGATTKEARLEDADGNVLAATADELTEYVEQTLLGLPFDHFTKCVVLPQGDFAEFLRAKPKERQDVLVKLLGLELYRRLAQAANQRASVAKNAVELFEARASGLAHATPESLRNAKSRVKTVEKLVARIDESIPKLEAVAKEAEGVEREASDVQKSVKQLGTVKVPKGVPKLAEKLLEASEKDQQTGDHVAGCTKVRQQAESALEELPSGDFVVETIRKHGRRDARSSEVEQIEADVEKSKLAAEAALAGLASAEGDADSAANALELLRRDHAAHHLAEGLSRGDRCPVCQRSLDEVPDLPAPAELKKAAKTKEAAAKHLATAKKSQAEAGQSFAGAQGRHAAAVEQLAELTRELADVPPVKALERQQASIETATAELTTARRNETEARKQHDAARSGHEKLKVKSKQVWVEFDETRDSVAAFGPPEVDRDKLAASWGVLETWAAEQTSTREALLETLTKRLTVSRALEVELQAALTEECATHDVEVVGVTPRDAAVEALAKARVFRDGVKAEIDEAKRLRKQIAEKHGEAVVAAELGKQLGARNFERWLLSRALTVLIIGATQILRDLSEDGYSLALETKDNSFLVVDHRNADETRPAKTLSGGETFLASLALALALSDQVAEMSARGAPRLESLFLDEGFGTLDPETLDTVATAIEELGARGRMVGLVTHVRELANRMPVRYEVRKVAGVSSVERVEA